MQRKTLLISLVIVAIVASAILYFSLQPKKPSQQATRQAINATQQTPQNVTRPQPKPPTIMARIEANEGGKVLVNGTGTTTWNSTKPFALMLEAIPERGYVLDHWLVNGTDAGGELRLNLRVVGNTTVTALFKKVSFTARFLNITVPVRVNVTGRVYAGDFTLGFNNSLAVEVAPYGVDDAGCVPYNRTHKACLLGWLNGSEPLYVRYLCANLTRDAVFVQLWKLVKANYSAALIDIWVGNTTIKTIAEPSKIMLVPFDATYGMVNGWFHIKGDDWVFYIKMPPWKKIKVYVNYTARVIEGAQIPGSVEVIVRDGPVFLSVGTYFYTMSLTVYTIDRGLVDHYANALTQCNYDADCMHNFYYTEKDFYKYVTCYNLVWDMACRPGRVMHGPSDRLMPGNWQPGDLHIEGSGEMWIKIEIVE